MHDPAHDPSAVSSWPEILPPDSMRSAVAAVESAPDDEEAWDALEELAEREQRPDVVEALYGRQLEAAPGVERIERLGPRALRFHDEWSGEADDLARLLRAVLRRDIGAGWAFERMTMLLTMGERWDELLALYDQALASTSDLTRRREILDEAAHLAKDFAGQPDRAIAYLDQLVQLRPTDGALAASLERLLEARGRHRELVKLWELRASVLDPDSSRALRLRTALSWLEQVGSPADAVRTLQDLLSDGYEPERVVATLERIAGQADAPAEARSKAFALLEDHFGRQEQAGEVLRVVEGALDVAGTPGERARLHRRAAALREGRGDERKALAHLAALVPLEPTDAGAQEALRRIGQRLEDHLTVAQALAGAADALDGQAHAVELREEAASLLAEHGQPDEAARQFTQVFWAQEATVEQARRVGERLWRGRLLATSQPGDLLPVLERLVELGPDPAERSPSLWKHDLLGEVAQVAREQGHPERALHAWELRLASDPEDQEAIHGRIEALEQLKRWEPLLAALRQRAELATDEDARRQDLVRIAKVVAATVDEPGKAIEAWREIEQNFGRSDDTVDALAELYERAGRREELETLLREAREQTRVVQRRAELRARSGELLAEQRKLPAALDLFLEALADDPASQRARRGLWGLLDDREVGGLALAGLVDACERTDDWRERLRLLDHRLQALSDEEARAAVLVEAAGDQENRAGDLGAAQQSVGRALELSPNSVALERHLLRLAEQTGHWDEAASALAHGLASAVALASVRGTPGRAHDLQMRLGQVLEQRLDDAPRALDAYRRVAGEDPRFPEALPSMIRVGAQLGLAEVVTEGVVQSILVHEHLDPALLSLIEDKIRTEEGWRALTRSLQKAIPQAPASTRHLLLRQLGRWQRDQLSALSEAEASLRESVTLDPSDERALEDLAELQRLHPDATLVSTLTQLSAARGGDEVALREAAELALEHLHDEALSRTLLTGLLSTAQGHWVSGQLSRTPEPPRAYVAWALERLVRILEQRGEHAAAIEALTGGARLPFEQPEVLSLLHQAALLARSALHDDARAASIYRDVLSLAPADPVALGSLAEIYRSSGDHAALVGLLRHELGLELPLERRLEVRLALASSAAQLGDPSLREGALRDNLRERPGHAASVTDIAAALEARGAHRELLTLLTEQASTLEHLDAPGEARPLWLRAAHLAEHALGDPSEAITALRRAAHLAETPEVLDSLGRLHMMRGEPAAAVPWLERRHASSSEEEVVEVVQRLASALAGAGQLDEARQHLSAIHQRFPHDRSLRAQLLSLYRSGQDWPALVELALTSADHEDDTPSRLALYLEAADVLQRRLDSPARAVDLLRRAAELAPQDRGLRTGLADALRSAGRLDEARQILEDLLGEFGRRRPPERAAVHYQLAQLAQARGDLTEALAQLDTASSMDLSHGGVLLLLGRLAREAGQLDRAERAFRALLLTLRRQRPDAPASQLLDIGLSEVAYELHRVAGQLGQTERAAEVLESAFAAAAQSPSEAARFERMLTEASDTPLLLRALTARLERAAIPAERASTWLDIARTHERLQHPDEAFSALEQALTLDPTISDAHQVAQRLAEQNPALASRIAHSLRALASASDPSTAASLWLQLGTFHEQRHELPQAAEAYEVAASTGAQPLASHRALVRVAAALADAPRQIRSLRALVELLADDEPAQLADSLYQLADLELSSAGEEPSGVADLERAFALAPRPAETLARLERAAASSSSRELLALYERLAREAADQPRLLDALERLARNGDDVFREAVALADQLGQPERAQALLARAVEARNESWAMAELGQRALAASDWPSAYQWWTRASQADDSDESFERGLRAAAIAQEHLANPTLATQAFRRLWSQRPSDRRAWEPLLGLLRQGGDSDALDTVLSGAAEATSDATDRRRLRMERAESLLDDAFRQDDAIGVLQQMLQDDPADSDAQGLLLRIYEQTGRSDELVGLLQQQFDSALERRALDEVTTLAQRLGGLLARRRRDDALTTYRRALQLLPQDPVLLRELLALLGPDGDAHERASLLEHLLLDDALPDGPRLAVQLADAREALQDDQGHEAALRRGLTLAPDDAGLRGRMESFYTSRQRWQPLSEMLVAEAEHQLEPAQAAARLHRAARLQAQQLRNPGAAIELLRRARTHTPDDLEVLRSLVDALLDAGDQEAARTEVQTALERTYLEPAARPQLLRLGALLALRQGHEVDAVNSLEQALALGSPEAATELLDALEQLRQSAARKGDGETQRASTLRLADLCLQGNATERGLGLLRQWIEQHPDDLEALRKLLDLETAAQNWPAAIDLGNRLVAADPSEARIDAALRLLEACTQAGNPADARAGLETAFSAFPQNAPARNALKQLYEQLGAQREQADILLHEAAAIEDEAGRFAPYKKAAELYLAAGFAPNAIPVLEAALHAKPGEHECTVLLTDCYIAMGQLAEATNLLETTIAAQKTKRSPQISTLQHRMARIALAAGDRSIEVQWLNAALDSDPQNGQVAAELADVATELGQLDIALKALRAITVAKNPGPMSKGMAFYRQGLINYHQGDPRKAVVMVKRGVQEDPSLAGEARTFLEQLGEKM